MVQTLDIYWALLTTKPIFSKIRFYIFFSLLFTYLLELTESNFYNIRLKRAHIMQASRDEYYTLTYIILSESKKSF